MSAAIVAVWLAIGLVFGLVALRAQLRRSPVTSAWNLVTALIYTALVPFAALEGDWPGTAFAVFLTLLRWLLWGTGRRLGRKGKVFG